LGAAGRVVVTGGRESVWEFEVWGMGVCFERV